MKSTVVILLKWFAYALLSLLVAEVVMLLTFQPILAREPGWIVLGSLIIPIVWATLLTFLFVYPKPWVPLSLLGFVLLSLPFVFAN